MRLVNKAICISLVVASLSFWATSSALACSVIGKAILSSLPADGAQDVPIDVAPIVRGHWETDGIALEGPDGNAIEFELVNTSPGAGGFSVRVAELKPRSALRPNSRYVLRAKGPNPNGEKQEMQISFTTGTSTADEITSEPPVLSASVLTRRPDPACLLENAVACVSVSEPSSVFELTNARGEVLARDVFSGDVFTYIDDPECVRVWKRSAAGKLSEPSELCGKKLATKPAARELDGTYSCRDGAFRRNDGRPDEEEQAPVTASNADDDESAKSDTDGGCAVAPNRDSSPSLLFALFVVLPAWIRGARWLRVRRTGVSKPH